MSKDIPPIEVGAIFERFAQNKHVAVVDRATVSAKGLLGQGVTYPGDGDLTGSERARADIRHATHKHNVDNVLIQNLAQDGTDSWRAKLSVGPSPEVLSDHVTGQHIPALVLIEAARQFWTATVERHLNANDGPVRLVVESISGQFTRYVFPLPTDIAGVSLSETNVSGGAVRTEFKVSFIQGGEECATVTASILRIDEALADMQESIAARAAIKKAIGAYQGDPQS